MDISSLVASPVVQRMRARVVASNDTTFAEQLRLVAIPAPTLEEGERAKHLANRLGSFGLDHLHIDDAGNVLGAVPRTVQAAAAPIVVAAHLDTVFPRGSDLTPRREGPRTYAPGIADNARGLAALVTLAEVFTRCRAATRRPIWLVGTVGEEGTGDLRGVKHLFRRGGPFSAASAFLSLDGSGLRRIVHRAIGARRLRVTMHGPGGHSWSDWGIANPIHALGSAIADLQFLVHDASTPTTLTVARVHGGTSINTIPAQAWIELDIRGEDAAAIARLEREARLTIQTAIEKENAGRRHGSAPLRARIDVIGDRPSGVTTEDSVIVQTAMAATHAVGVRPELVASSTDANVPIALGIPAVTFGAGGESGGIHTTSEWYSNRDAARGIERALLAILSVAGLVGDGAVSTPAEDQDSPVTIE